MDNGERWVEPVRFSLDRHKMGLRHPDLLPVPPACKRNEPVAPAVRLLHSPCKPQSKGATVELMCIISNFSPASVEVSWLENNEPKSLSPFMDRPWKDASGSTFSTVSTVNVSQADWLAGASYACQVTHQATGTTVKSQAGKCTGNSSRRSGGSVRLTVVGGAPCKRNSDKAGAT